MQNHSGDRNMYWNVDIVHKKDLELTRKLMALIRSLDQCIFLCDDDVKVMNESEYEIFLLKKN